MILFDTIKKIYIHFLLIFGKTKRNAQNYCLFIGLGAYEDSDSDNSDGESDKNEQDANESYDSEEELKVFLH